MYYKEISKHFKFMEQISVMKISEINATKLAIN